MPIIRPPENTGTFNPSQITNFSLVNKDYDTISVKIRVEGNDPPGPTHLGPGQRIDIIVSYSKGKVTFKYGGKQLQQLDLNNGGSSDDLNAPNSDKNGYNTLRFNPGDPQGHMDVINFDNSTFMTKFSDNDGINGGQRVVFNQSVQDSTLVMEMCRP